MLGGGPGLKRSATEVNVSSNGKRRLQCCQLITLSYDACWVEIHMDNEIDDMAILAGMET